MIRPYSLLQNELSTLDFFGIQEVEMSKNLKKGPLTRLPPYLHNQLCCGSNITIN
jgi:hypothetical protein